MDEYGQEGKVGEQNGLSHLRVILNMIAMNNDTIVHTLNIRLTYESIRDPKKSSHYVLLSCNKSLTLLRILHRM